MKHAKYAVVALLLLMMAMVVATACSPAEPMSDEVKQMASASIEEQDQVIDSDIRQDGHDLSLILVVSYATTPATAKQLGDNFVRMVKSLGPDDSPGRTIGEGKYDYVIGVYYPNQDRVALGAKVRGASRISW